jgi:F-type H+-transporting ATPase subunit b
MEEILHAFGINGKLIIIQIVNFAILAGVLTYFLYTPVLKLLSEREAKIKKGVEDAESATKALETADVEKKHIVGIAHKDAEKISVRAKQYADQKSIEIINEAETKAKHVLAGAHARGEEIKASAQRESESEIAKVAILMAEKILREKGV